MKKIASFLFVFFCVIATTFAQEQTTITRFEGKKITGIISHGAFAITITQGTSTKATVNIPARLESKLKFSLDSDGILSIYMQGRMHHEKNDRYTAEIVCSSLKKIELSGACKINATGNFTSRIFNINLSGAAKTNFEGKLTIQEKAKIDLSGASLVKGYITSPEIFIEQSGASSITFSGKTTRCEVEASGASKTNLEKFPIDILKAEISGASKAQFLVNKEISVHTSGASKITYIGNPKIITQESSGASKINKVVKKPSEINKEYQK
ncbi:GIN domain-containing protein [Butyricimonas paravirosa]|uniref:GIN domain-containing protein n=1 Tax=Butyricimonas paravirosa TaxID=1472417 RepID=UPI00210CE606|nr:DUF2807 domain-containing protein [Butyricimonas paravirosa]MCQ4872963.1 DUF2807 domain-containing protein [Butyricimonas paravirosa]